MLSVIAFRVHAAPPSSVSGFMFPCQRASALCEPRAHVLSCSPGTQVGRLDNQVARITGLCEQTERSWSQLGVGSAAETLPSACYVQGSRKTAGVRSSRTHLKSRIGTIQHRVRCIQGLKEHRAIQREEQPYPRVRPPLKGSPANFPLERRRSFCDPEHRLPPRTGQALELPSPANACLPPRTVSRRTFLSGWGSMLALAAGSSQLPEAARAENVRLEDVESPQLQRALEAAFAGDLDTAEGLFTQLIVENKDSASMWSDRGSVRLSLRKYEAAIQDFSRAVELAPQASVPFLNRAIAYEALGRYQEAADDCQQAIANDPKESAAWFNLGNVEIKQGQYQRALGAYQTAADLSPGIAGYRLREANTLFQVGFASDAERMVRSIVRKYPNYAEAHAALAGMLWGDGKLSLAEEQLSEALEVEPNFDRISWVNTNVEWPPKLLSAYTKFLSIS